MPYATTDLDNPHENTDNTLAFRPHCPQSNTPVSPSYTSLLAISQNTNPTAPHAHTPKDQPIIQYSIMLTHLQILYS